MISTFMFYLFLANGEFIDVLQRARVKRLVRLLRLLLLSNVI